MSNQDEETTTLVAGFSFFVATLAAVVTQSWLVLLGGIIAAMWITRKCI